MDILTKEATDKAWYRSMLKTPKGMYQTSHRYLTMALSFVTAICLIVKYFGKSLLKTTDNL